MGNGSCASCSFGIGGNSRRNECVCACRSHNLCETWCDSSGEVHHLGQPSERSFRQRVRGKTAVLERVKADDTTSDLKSYR
jgi:hypothetical protein